MTSIGPIQTSQVMSGKAKGFTLIEVICSLGILSIICSSAMVIMSRDKESAYNVTMRLRALDVARENMEQVLVSKTAQEQTEYGTSEKFPSIEWEMTIESFYSPLEGETWARARSMARYKDMDDNEQEIELEHWLCKVSESDINDLNLLNSPQSSLFKSIEEAAEFAGVDKQQVLTWLENGMVQTQEGYFIEANLLLFQQTGGNPSQEELDQQPTTGVFEDAAGQDTEAGMDGATPDVPDGRGGR